MEMTETSANELINGFLGSAQIFASAVSQILEQRTWREASGGQLGVTHLKVLKLAGCPLPPTVGEVAAFLRVSNAAASKAVDKLAELRLLERSTDAQDRRSVRLTLTEPGRRVLEAYDSAVRRDLSEVFRSFAPGEIRQAMGFLDRLAVDIVRRAPHEEFCGQCGIYFREECLFRKQLRRRCVYLRQQEDIPRRAAVRGGPAGGAD